MSHKPNKGKFKPKAGGKKKKRKKVKKQSNNEPELDPHFTESISKQQEVKPRKKFERKTKFELDTEAPTIQISGGFNRNRNNNNRNNKPNTRTTVPRRPRGTRSAVKTTGVSTNKMRKLGDLEKAEKNIRTRIFAPQVLEDESGSEEDEEEEKKELMDIDMDQEEENEVYDPWMVKGDNGDEEIPKYTPTILKSKPNYGKKGIFLGSEMLNVFKEKEYGNEFMFIQMPPVLPLVSHLNEDEERDLKSGRKVKVSLLRQMGEGKIGKIRIRKSGKTELVIGDYVMDVNFSSSIDCYQQVMYIHCENMSDRSVKGKSQFLGDVPPQNNLVCSYRAEDLLQ